MKIQNKFLLGIVTAMLSVFLISITMFLEIWPPHSVEFEIQPLTLELENVFQTEINLAEQFLKSRDTVGYQKWAFTSKIFRNYLDSLSNLESDAEFKSTLAALMQLHERYERGVQSRYRKVKESLNFKGEDEWIENRPVKDSLFRSFRDYKTSHGVLLSDALRLYLKQMKNVVTVILVILVVILVIAWVLARPFAFSMTKPIRALRDGTLKVGDGQYETVPVTSNDEVADLTNAFNMMSDKLKRLDEMRMQMMSEISHEMRTPLQVIKAGCYSIVHAKDGPQLSQRQRDAVGMIHQATNRINNFVNSFLDIAKMEAGLMKFNFQPADVVELVTPLIQEAQLIAQTRQIVLFSHADIIPPMTLDKERISQLFSNLLSNALKYTPDGGKITVNVNKLAPDNKDAAGGKESVMIEVHDTGVGIPEADIGKLFNKFYQAKNVPLVNEKGSGLGLALVKHVAEAHGGRVGVTSQVGIGSAFRVVIPVNA